MKTVSVPEIVKMCQKIVAIEETVGYHTPHIGPDWNFIVKTAKDCLEAIEGENGG